jgi:glycosyltransferase involved in cell wall biosynthesis
MKLNSNGLSLPTSLLISLYRMYAKMFIKPVVKKGITFNDLIECAKKQKNMNDNNIKISVVVPNYNYEKFLVQRIYSILDQKVKIHELIILDDCSKDNSRDLIDIIYNKISKYINIKKVYNDSNSGSAFKQWEKGFNIATGDYVWMAEADDYCDKDLLKSIIKPLYKDSNIVISYSDTAFIDINGKIIIRTIKPEIDIMKTGHWDKSYINSGKDEIKNYTYLNCTIANVSSTLIKKENYDEFFKMSGEYKQAGDWLFYANVINKGKIAYYNKPLNYYRVHGNNVSSVMKKQAHIDEIKKIHKYFDKKFNLDKKQKNEIEKRYDFLNKAWNLK